MATDFPMLSLRLALRARREPVQAQPVDLTPLVDELTQIKQYVATTSRMPRPVAA